jgi:hypothetical protein
MIRRIARVAPVITLASLLRAQTPPTAPADSAPKPAPTANPSVAVSGLMFGNYQYHTTASNRDFSQFLLERAYVTLRASLGQGLSARVTTDVFQSGDANGWTIRLKYAYLQHDAKGARGSNASTRIGMLHNVITEHIETHWPRFLGSAATERTGYFASADVGVAELVTLPNKLGEVYVTIVNGSGYTRRETDRFKDLALRFSLTPLAARTTGLFSTLVATGWVSDGAQASRFANGGAGQVGAIRQGLQKDRSGVFVGLRDPRLTGGFEITRREDQDESGSNTALQPRVVRDVKGSIRGGFLLLRPLAFVNESGRSRLTLVGRYDDVRPGSTAALDDADERFHFLVAGAIWDLTARLNVALDYQEQLARRDLVAESKVWFAHFQLNF